jgi:hypothetical protein
VPDAAASSPPDAPAAAPDHPALDSPGDRAAVPDAAPAPDAPDRITPDVAAADVESIMCSNQRCAPGQVCGLVLCYGDDGIQCKNMPATCPEEPVCGCDLVTYPSICALTAAGMAQQRRGPCWAAPVFDSDASDYFSQATLLPGRWGGDGVQMEVTASGVSFQFRCGTGSYAAKPLMKNHGRALTGWALSFSWDGTYKRNGAGAAVRATFSGSASLAPGDRFSLQVSAEPGSYYRLEPGKSGAFTACPAP